MMEENNAYDFCKPYLMPGEMILWRGMSHQVFLALENLSDVARAQNALSQLTAGREELQ